MPSIKAGSVRKGMYLLFKQQPHLVTKADFMSPGKGSAFMRLKLKSLITQNTVDFSYKSNEQVEEIEVESLKLQFLYFDKDQVVFMNDRSFEQVEVPRSFLEDKLDLLSPDVAVYVLSSQGKTLGVSFPPKVSLKVEKAYDSSAGNTVGQARKEVEMETGLKVMAPIFVKPGDTLVIDSDSKQYLSRG